MARFNRGTPQPKPQPVIATGKTPTLLTGNNAPGYQRTVLGELFLLGISNFYSEDTFYEKGADRDERYINLINEAVRLDGHWVTRFLRWLRHDANMRTAAIVGAVEAMRAMLKYKVPGGRIVINSVLLRADEPGEMLSYYINNYGDKLPMPLKRGVADATGRLYTERNALKYDTESKRIRFGSVLQLVHTAPTFPHYTMQMELFPYLVTVARGRDNVVVPDNLTMLVANQALRVQARTQPQLLLNTARLRRAGMTWEAAKSLAGKQVGDKEFWEAMEPEMGYMALLRNLRNFDQAGISNDVANRIVARLTDPDEVAKSRQLPLRFLSAYRNVVSDRWKYPLSQALELSLGAIAQVPGRTLILVDTSGSMEDKLSDKSQLSRHDAAVMFGLALARRCDESTVVSFSSSTKVFPQVPGETLLQSIKRWEDGRFNMRGGTDTPTAVNRHYDGHHRIVCLTDEQFDGNVSSWGWGRTEDPYAQAPTSTMCVTFNLAGYRAAQNASSPTRVTVGGLSDQAFQMLSILEAGARQQWPF